MLSNDNLAVRTSEFPFFMMVGQARIGAQRIGQSILADSQHNPDGLGGCGDYPLTICVDLHQEAYVNSAHLAEAASPKIGRLYRPGRADEQANGYILTSSPRIRGKSPTDVYLGPPWLPQKSFSDRGGEKTWLSRL
jgi:hypothetical protein